ncbi:hypothetical protein A2154_02465 [Candidatus Gottesmanbacteria bacterium RBG_16_43_7]|uniref:N-acetyltransferase domain-containing protein n=1 Tax=Candidatus Gottesmanbacteria bacterium RBG_16_43_7 TaxID=1798373 RepID=A0A1F5ZCS7_9BACT|nr:MAG: hypothetical protein A2154_02465 [Candidatus Gottesmanbacteria bacterium RBG_16_43_7]
MKLKPGQIIKQSRSRDGREIVYRLPKTADLETMRRFANELSTEDTFVQLSGERITKKAESQYLTEALAAIENGEKIQIIALFKQELIANASVTKGKKRKAHAGELAISVAAPFRGQGIGEELLQLLTDLSRKNGLRLLTLTCFENNQRAINLYEKVGFTKAGFIPGMYQRQGRYWGEIIMYLPLI